MSAYLVGDRAVGKHDSWAFACVEDEKAVDKVIPEASISPVFDSKRGSKRDREVFRAIDLVELVAEVKSSWRTMAALTHVFELQADRFANVAEPLKVCSAVAVDTTCQVLGSDEYSHVRLCSDRLGARLRRCPWSKQLKGRTSQQHRTSACLRA